VGGGVEGDVLATKNDLLLVRQNLEHFEQKTNARFDVLESTLEYRIVFKLGALMVVLFGLAGTAPKVLC
jgi:hypothetical protein